MSTQTDHNTPKRQIAILGSTGSIGTQALQVIEEHSDLDFPGTAYVPSFRISIK